MVKLSFRSYSNIFQLNFNPVVKKKKKISSGTFVRKLDFWYRQSALKGLTVVTLLLTGFTLCCCLKTNPTFIFANIFI